jgi:exopolyphosphatase/pppGpp-phosphohydrolase
LRIASAGGVRDGQLVDGATMQQADGQRGRLGLQFKASMLLLASQASSTSTSTSKSNIAGDPKTAPLRRAAMLHMLAVGARQGTGLEKPKLGGGRGWTIMDPCLCHQ